MTALACTLSLTVRAAGPPVVVFQDPGVDRSTAARVRNVIRAKRSVVDLRPLPAAQASSAQSVQLKLDVDRIKRALSAAAAFEANAKWRSCYKTVAEVMSTATDILTRTGEISLLRQLYVKQGVCLTLNDPASAKPFFLKATMIDESPPKAGMVRVEAEQLWSGQRDDVQSRLRGPVQIVTDPPGAHVWLDGTKLDGVTPLTVTARLGQHFVTLRRFRYEPVTVSVPLQPGMTQPFVLTGAETQTLREQLRPAAEGTIAIEPVELRLAQTVWSGAPELILLGKRPGPTTSVEVSLIDAKNGGTIRSGNVAGDADDATVLSAVCDVLGENCAPPGGLSTLETLAIAALSVVAAAGVSTAVGFAIDDARGFRFCPSGGCD